MTLTPKQVLTQDIDETDLITDEIPPLLPIENQPKMIGGMEGLKKRIKELPNFSNLTRFVLLTDFL